MIETARRENVFRVRLLGADGSRIERHVDCESVPAWLDEGLDIDAQDTAIWTQLEAEARAEGLTLVNVWRLSARPGWGRWIFARSAD